MKLFGETISEENIEYIVIPRGNRDDIIFKAAAVLSFDEFNRLCPLPKPPRKMVKGGKVEDDSNDEGYKQQILDYSERRVSWMVLQSLKGTEGLEWETVKETNPTTWSNYKKELEDAKFTISEINRIINGVLSANSLNESVLERARLDFLLTIAPAPEK